MVTLLTTQVGHITLTKVVKETQWLKRVIRELGMYNYSL